MFDGRRLSWLYLTALAAALACWTAPALSGETGANLPRASFEAVGTAYRADVPFPQFMHLWSEAWALKGQDGEPQSHAASSMPLGACLQLYVRNGSTNTLHITDVTLEGVSLSKAIAFSEHKAGRCYPASIHFSNLPKEDIAGLVAAGEPVWWKAEPVSVSPGGFGEVSVRLRRASKGRAVAMQVVATNAVCQARVPADDSPRFVSVSFSPALDTAYCYVRHSNASGAVPVKVFLDDQDLTVRTESGKDSAVNITPLVIRLAAPLVRGSFHVFRARFGDGSLAVAGTRAWGDELVYGMWGYINQGKTAEERVDYFLGDLRRHNVNAVMFSYGSEVTAFLSGESGLEHSRSLGIRAMRTAPGKVLNPLYYFLKDEPDAHDFAVRGLEPTQRLGALGQDLVRLGWHLREQDPATPQLVNVDNTYKPENWYTYAQLPDVYCADPYFQEQQRIAWNERPARAASVIKPWYVLGAATICSSACAPKPLHIILNAVRHDKPGGGGFRFATPAEKTLELFYALGAGAKGFSYWWYTPYGECHGCGSKDEAALTLWRQIGRLGAQVRLAGTVLTRSCPAEVACKAPAALWTRTLVAGTDALVLLACNENVASDRLGTVVVPLANAVVTLQPPAWLKATDAFEITPEGIRDADWKVEDGLLVLNLERTEVARMVLFTSDVTLRSRLTDLYRTRFADNAPGLQK